MQWVFLFFSFVSCALLSQFNKPQFIKKVAENDQEFYKMVRTSPCAACCSFFVLMLPLGPRGLLELFVSGPCRGAEVASLKADSSTAGRVVAASCLSGMEPMCLQAVSWPWLSASLRPVELAPAPCDASVRADTSRGLFMFAACHALSLSVCLYDILAPR